MFLENSINKEEKRGWIEVICGSMFSGKTEELIRRLKRARIAKQKVEIYKPHIDTRYSEHEVVSHDENSIVSTPVTTAANILLLATDVDVIGIDEAQFFDQGLVEVCNILANRGIRDHCGRSGYGLYGKAFRSHPGSAGHCRIRHQGACHLCKVRQPGPAFPQDDGRG